MTAGPCSRAFVALAAVIAVIVVIVLGAEPAGAEPAGAEPGRAPPEADGRTKAAAHFKQGQAFFQREDYDRAVTEYQAAFDLTPEPLLVFNIALCHDRAKRPEQALQAFQRYIELAPNGPVADEARDDVARLAPIVDKIATDRAVEEARLREEAARRQAVPPKPKPRAQPSRLPRYLMVAGAAGAAVGATAHVLAWRTRDQLMKAPDPGAYFSDRDTFESERGVAIGAYAAGAATIVTGLILSLVLRPHDGLEISVASTPGGAAVAVGWSR